MRADELAWAQDKDPGEPFSNSPSTRMILLAELLNGALHSDARTHFAHQIEESE